MKALISILAIVLIVEVFIFQYGELDSQNTNRRRLGGKHSRSLNRHPDLGKRMNVIMPLEELNAKAGAKLTMSEEENIKKAKALQQTIVMMGEPLDPKDDTGIWLVAIDPALNSTGKLIDLSNYQVLSHSSKGEQYRKILFAGDTTDDFPDLMFLEIKRDRLTPTNWPRAPFSDEDLVEKLNRDFPVTDDTKDNDILTRKQEFYENRTTEDTELRHRFKGATLGDILAQEGDDRVRTPKWKKGAPPPKDHIWKRWSTGQSGATKGVRSNVTIYLEALQTVAQRKERKKSRDPYPSMESILKANGGNKLRVPILVDDGLEIELGDENFIARILQLPPNTPIQDSDKRYKLVFCLLLMDGARTWRTPGPLYLHAHLEERVRRENALREEGANYEYIFRYGCQIPDPEEYLKNNYYIVEIVGPGGNANQFAMAMGKTGSDRIQEWVGDYGSGLVAHCGTTMYVSQGASKYRNEAVDGNDPRVGGDDAEELYRDCFPKLMAVQYSTYRGYGPCPVQIRPGHEDEGRDMGLIMEGQSTYEGIYDHAGSPFLNMKYKMKTDNKYPKGRVPAKAHYPLAIDLAHMRRNHEKWTIVNNNRERNTKERLPGYNALVDALRALGETGLGPAGQQRVKNTGKLSTKVAPAASGKYGKAQGPLWTVVNHPEKHTDPFQKRVYQSVLRQTMSRKVPAPGCERNMDDPVMEWVTLTDAPKALTSASNSAAVLRDSKKNRTQQKKYFGPLIRKIWCDNGKFKGQHDDKLAKLFVSHDPEDLYTKVCEKYKVYEPRPSESGAVPTTSMVDEEHNNSDKHSATGSPLHSPSEEWHSSHGPLDEVTSEGLSHEEAKTGQNGGKPSEDSPIVNNPATSVLSSVPKATGETHEESSEIPSGAQLPDMPAAGSPVAAATSPVVVETSKPDPVEKKKWVSRWFGWTGLFGKGKNKKAEKRFNLIQHPEQNDPVAVYGRRRLARSPVLRRLLEVANSEKSEEGRQ